MSSASLSLPASRFHRGPATTSTWRFSPSGGSRAGPARRWRFRRPAGRCIALGVGDPDKVTAETLRRAAAAFVRATWRAGSGATTILAAAPAALDPAAAAQAVVEGASLAAYRFGHYKSDPSPSALESMAVVGAVVGAGDLARDGLDRGARVAAAVALARDIVNQPARTMTPRRLAALAGEVAEAGGLTLTVFDEHEIVAERLDGLAGVALGSDEPARLIKLVYEPRARRRLSIALVGQGHHLRLRAACRSRPAEGMETMKTDMSGARRRPWRHVRDRRPGPAR